MRGSVSFEGAFSRSLSTNSMPYALCEEALS